jgi:uncharacterized protein YycO
MYTPRPGDYGVIKTKGFFGKLIRVGTQSRWNHVFIYVGADQIVEANPTGVEVSPLFKYDNVAWNKHEELTDEQRNHIVFHARALVGKPYNFFVIADLALRILGFKLFTSKILERMSKGKGYICSELVAECYRKANKILVREEDYLVNPGDLAERLIYQ